MAPADADPFPATWQHDADIIKPQLWMIGIQLRRGISGNTLFIDLPALARETLIFLLALLNFGMTTRNCHCRRRCVGEADLANKKESDNWHEPQNFKNLS